MRLAACLVLVALGCSSVPPSVASGPMPLLVVHSQPDVRIVAMQLDPTPEGLTLAGRFFASQPLLPAGRPASVQGLDADGAVLFERSVSLRVESAPGRWTGPLPATLRAPLPRPAGLQTVRVTLSGG